MCIAVTVYFKFLDINNIKAMKAVIAKTEEVIQIQLSNKYTANAANKAALNILEIFGSISGLKVNTEKTQIVWIGKKKHSKEKIACKSYTWTTVTNFKLLGIIFSVDLDKCPELNYSVKKAKIKESISQWNKRYLTPLGKVTVIKTFLMSKINHLFTTLPDPKEKFINEINDIFFKFFVVW